MLSACALTNGYGQHVFLKRAPLPKMQLRVAKVHHNGERVKVSREVRVGMELTIQQGIDKKTVVIKELSDVRGPAPVAQKLYEETEVSITRRELIASQRKLHNLARPDHRPSKKDRRDISKFRQENDQQFDQYWSYNDDE